MFFVASPLHYLAAQRVAADHEAAARRVLVYYNRALRPLVRAEPWDAVLYMPWPRFEPLPGPFGGHRRLLENLDRVAAAVGSCDTLVLHSPVYDTEAINYFLRALPRRAGARTMHARILPDGLLNIERYPLSRARRLAQSVRKLRRLVSPELDYWTFSGDRIGSDAPFVDRIYVLSGFPHCYRAQRVVRLAPLVPPAQGPEQDRVPSETEQDRVPSETEQDRVPSETGSPTRACAGMPARRALVVGQPLVGFGLMDEADRAQVAASIASWLSAQGIAVVDYKAHPREGAAHDLWQAGYRLLEIDEPIETWMAHSDYAVVVGCCSTALFIAREIYGARARVAAFGVERVRFKGAGKRESTLRLMRALAIEIH
ncbi:MAG: hypothetical protein JSW68_06960 [Burkholderiales bacterium]|nr:MAG: hypothetical protein JSW68_06960 [Burkholderiales bacterium]